MKKSFSIKLILIGMLSAMSLASCNKSNSNFNNNPSDPVKPTEPTKQLSPPSNVFLTTVSSEYKDSLEAVWVAAMDDDTPSNQLLYELHASTIQGFEPNSSTLIYSGKNVTSIYVEDKFNGGDLYYVKLVVVDKNGERTVSDSLQVIISNSDTGGDPDNESGGNDDNETGGNDDNETAKPLTVSKQLTSGTSDAIPLVTYKATDSNGVTIETFLTSNFDINEVSFKENINLDTSLIKDTVTNGVIEITYPEEVVLSTERIPMSLTSDSEVNYIYQFFYDDLPVAEDSDERTKQLVFESLPYTKDETSEIDFYIYPRGNEKLKFVALTDNLPGL